MRYPEKIRGLRLTEKERKSSLKAIGEFLGERNVIFGDWRISSAGVIEGTTFTTPNSIDFAITAVEEDGDYLLYSVNIMNEKINLPAKELMVVPGYHVYPDATKVLCRAILVPLEVNG